MIPPKGLSLRSQKFGFWTPWGWTSLVECWARFSVYPSTSPRCQGSVLPESHGWGEFSKIMGENPTFGPCFLGPSKKTLLFLGDDGNGDGFWWKWWFSRRFPLEHLYSLVKKKELSQVFVPLPQAIMLVIHYTQHPVKKLVLLVV